MRGRRVGTYTYSYIGRYLGLSPRGQLHGRVDMHLCAAVREEGAGS